MALLLNGDVAPTKDEAEDAGIRSARQLLLDMLVMHLASDRQMSVTMIEELM